MNVHRWRLLEGSDPKAEEMVKKIQTLQRRLISKTEEVVEKEMKCQDLQKQVENLQVILSRQVREIALVSPFDPAIFSASFTSLLPFSLSFICFVSSLPISSFFSLLILSLVSFFFAFAAWNGSFGACTSLRTQYEAIQ